MHKAIIGTFFAFTVSACGGGGTSSGNSAGITILQSYEAGETALMRVKPVTSDYTYTGVADVAAVNEVANGSIAGLTETYSTDDGDWFTVGRTGVMSTGGTITFDTVGVNLNSSGSEYVSRNLIQTSDGAGYVVVGAPLKLAPAGAQTYTGFTEIYESGYGGVAQEAGDVTLNVNFTSGAASITGATTNYVFSSSNMTVDINSGNFYTDNGKIGRRSGVQVDANIAGAIYGTTGLGAGGVVHSDLDADTGFIGAFAATR
jgi:hypothetical protein